jgi:L-iditol 2-dehydrogenase
MHYNQSIIQFRLPDNVSFDEGALLEPLSVGVHACQKVQVSLGDKVLVCGAGPIGLVSLLSAKSFGTSEIVVTDINEHRLKIAKECGATHIVKINKDETSEEVAQRVIDVLGCRPDKTIECSGTPSAISTAIYATKSGGVVVIVGVPPPEVSLPIVEASIREVDIRSIFRYIDNCFKISLEMLASGKIDVKPLISHRYSLDKVIEAFDTARTGRDGAIKVIIDCS